MKRRISILSIFLLCISVSHAQDFSPEDTVLEFFHASQQGNIEEMKSLTAGSFYNRRKELFENNPSYSDFMIKHYEGTRIDIDKVINDANENIATVDVTVTYPENGTDKLKYILKKDENGLWKIVLQQTK